jgi:hypothetical protein
METNIQVSLATGLETLAANQTQNCNLQVEVELSKKMLNFYLFFCFLTLIQ